MLMQDEPSDSPQQDPQGRLPPSLFQPQLKRELNFGGVSACRSGFICRKSDARPARRRSGARPFRLRRLGLRCVDEQSTSSSQGRALPSLGAVLRSCAQPDLGGGLHEARRPPAPASWYCRCATRCRSPKSWRHCRTLGGAADSSVPGWAGWRRVRRPRCAVPRARAAHGRGHRDDTRGVGEDPVSFPARHIPAVIEEIECCRSR